MKEVNLYSPIEVTTYENDNQYPTIIDGIPYNDKIAETLETADTAAGDRGLMSFLSKSIHPDLNKKVNSIRFSLEVLNGELFCVTSIHVIDGQNLTTKEMSSIKDYITSQYSDGIGQIIEQTTIFADDIEIYASLWQNNSWVLMSQSEFDKLTAVENNIHKPDAPMIGANGNIFAQLAIAKKALLANGQEYAANEMLNRVMNSDSYDGALRVICEYVTPVNKKEYKQKNDTKNRPKER